MGVNRIILLELNDTNDCFTEQLLSLLKKQKSIILFDSMDLIVGELKIVTNDKLVYKNGEKISLTLKEYEILYFLASHIDRVFSKEQIYEAIWNEPSDSCIHSIENMISRLRKKIEDDYKHPEYIVTVYGFGYKFKGKEN